MIVRAYKEMDFNDWKRLRMELWPEATSAEHKEEMEVISSGDVFSYELGWSIFVAEENGKILGFIESSLRESICECESSPIGYIEGWYVDKNHRKKGVGKGLTEEAEKWAKSKGCSNMASDVEFDNKASLEAHQHLGYKIVGKDEDGNILVKDI